MTDAPRLIGLLSFYDEQASMLRDCLGTVGWLDHLVAVDGAYGTFPGARPRSHPSQHQALLKAAGPPLALHLPDGSWDGGEVAKRAAMFRYASVHARPGIDWYVIVDSDERWRPFDVGLVRRKLAATDLHTANVSLSEKGDSGQWRRFPKFFRALPGLTVARNHYTYLVDGGPVLWGPGEGDRAGLAAYVYVDHVERGNQARAHRAKRYYRDRDASGVEDQPHLAACQHDGCGRPAEEMVPANPRYLDTKGPPLREMAGDTGVRIKAPGVHLCAEHAARQRRRLVTQLRAMGVDVDNQSLAKARYY